jgi:integrase
VQTIRDRKKLAQIKNLLRGQRRFRDLLLFVVGINTALRVSDLLSLRISDFVDEAGGLNPASGSARRSAASARRW